MLTPLNDPVIRDVIAEARRVYGRRTVPLLALGAIAGTVLLYVGVWAYVVAFG